MRCFTDAELHRGIEAVIAATVGAQVCPELAASDLQIFLQAAQPTDGATDDEWPITHPMHCRDCARAITDASGTALVTIWIVERQWRCAACAGD